MKPVPEQIRVPAAAPDDLLSWVDDDRRRDLSNLLSAAVPEGSEFALVHDGVVWTGRTGRTDWLPHRGPVEVAKVPPVVPAIPDRVPKPNGRKGGSRAGVALLVPGLGLAAASGALAAVQHGRAGGEGLRGQSYERAKTLYRVGQGGAVLGGVLGATGLVTVVVTR